MGAGQEDNSLLLRGSELSAAESWLAGAKADADPPPTELQRTYLLRSRQANLRRQRRFAGTGLTVAAVAVALLIFALISRGQAVTAESTASSRARWPLRARISWAPIPRPLSCCP